MELQSFYTLKERLEYAAVAGVSLLDEDFRLRRAVEELAPLAAASPVFGKIRAGAEALLAAPKEERPGKLLSLLSLVDAVAYTQGRAGREGTLEPLPCRGGGRYVPLRYGELKPVLNALTTTGPGRYEVLRESLKRPELLADSRVLAALVHDLKDSFGEMADQVEAVLRRAGPAVAPLLCRDFDPAGKKDMVRRVRILEDVAGGDANDFYLAQLPHAVREVRVALIRALGHREENAETLIRLCRTEKGSAKKAAHWTLARLDCPPADTYWTELSEKKPDQAAGYMTFTHTPLASRLVAQALDAWLSPLEEQPDTPLTEAMAERLQALLFALPGKTGSEICDVYRRLATLGKDGQLDLRGIAGTDPVRVMKLTAAPGDPPEHAHPFRKVLPLVLRRSILTCPAPELLALPDELETLSGVSFRAAAIAAALAAGSAEEAYAAAEPCLKPAGLFFRGKLQGRTALLAHALDGLDWDWEQKTLVFTLTWPDPLGGAAIRVSRPLREPPDHRWYQRLMALDSSETDSLLSCLLPMDDGELRGEVGAYFYQKTLTLPDCRPYLGYLKRCGWTQCKGLAVRYCQRKGSVTPWELTSLLRELPGSGNARADEAEQVMGLIHWKKIQYPNGSLTQLNDLIRELRAADPTPY